MLKAALPLLLIVGASLSRATEACRTMAPRDRGGVHLLDVEYLPFDGDTPLRYPDDVVFGFPNGGGFSWMGGQ